MALLLGCGGADGEEGDTAATNPSATSDSTPAASNESSGSGATESDAPNADDLSAEKIAGSRLPPRKHFKTNRAACSDFSMKSLARQVKAPQGAGPARIAKAYRRFLAFDGPERIQNAIEAGCRAGILDRLGR